MDARECLEYMCFMTTPLYYSSWVQRPQTGEFHSCPCWEAFFRFVYPTLKTKFKGLFCNESTIKEKEYSEISWDVEKGIIYFIIF